MNARQHAFIEEYLKCWSATEAARRVGYAQPHSQGPRLLENVGVDAEIKARLAEKTLSADEVLVRLAEQARGEHAKYMSLDGEVNFAALIADGKAHLIKGIKNTKYGLDIEFYDAQAALVHLGKHLGLFKERIDVTSGDERIGADAEEYHRAVTTLSQALRGIVGPADAGAQVPVDAAKPAAMDGPALPGG